MFKYLWNILWNYSEEECIKNVTLEEALASFAEAEKREQAEAVKLQPKVPEFSNYSCMNKTGTITSCKENTYEIDNTYVYHTEQQEFEVGAEVSFTVYVVDQELRVVKVSCLDDWNTKSAPEKSSWCNRKLVSRITKRNGRKVYVSPENIWCDLNKVRVEFVPIVGDWIELEVKVEISEKFVELFGDILEVVSIAPLRVQVLKGNVRTWDNSSQKGNINYNIFFDRNVCLQGYLPRIGDKVIVESIESTQGTFTWRAIKLLPDECNNELKISNIKSTILLENNKENFENKRDVTVSECSNFELCINETQAFTLKVSNCSTEARLLAEAKFEKPSEQYVLTSNAAVKDVSLKSNESFEIHICLQAKHLGVSKETLIFDFGDFQIHRQLTLYCSPKANAVSSAHAQVAHSSYDATRLRSKTCARFRHNVESTEDVIRGQQLCSAPRFIAKRLHSFPVPEHMVTVMTDSFENGLTPEQIVDNLISGYKCLRQDLSVSNYEERFHTLLYIWEMSTWYQIRQYDRDRALFVKNGEYLMLEIENLNERRPSLIAGDKMLVWNAYDDSAPRYEGYIHKVGAKHVYLKFAAFFHERYDGEDYSVQVIQGRTVFKRMHQALNLVMQHLGRDYAFPNRVHTKECQVKLKLKNDKPLLENGVTDVSTQPDQRTAIKSSASERILSPTTILLRTLHAKHKKHKMLKEQLQQETKQSPKSQEDSQQQKQKVSVVEEPPPKQQQQTKAPETETEPDDDLPEYDIKWFNSSLNEHQRAAVANVLLGEARPLPYIIFGPPGTGKTVTLIEAILQTLRNVSHSRIIVATPSNSSADLIATGLVESRVLLPGDLIRLVAHRCVTEGMVPAQLVPYASTIEIGRDGTHDRKPKVENGISTGVSYSVVGRHRITVATCMALGKLYSCDFAKGHFTHIFIDEAGQATEPELLVPIAFLDKDQGQVILAGDPLQLGPVLTCTISKYFGLDESFLERFISRVPYLCDPVGFPKTAGYDPRLITKLLYNYRSLPEILKLPNDMFYRGDLKPTISNKSSKEAKLLYGLQEILPSRADRDTPAIVFHGIVGENYQSADSPSWFNPCEAGQVFMYLNDLLRMKLSASDIGIITPYVKQVKQIRALIEEAEFEMPKVSTVEDFQGQEFNVIILSTVRSSESRD